MIKYQGKFFNTLSTTFLFSYSYISILWGSIQHCRKSIHFCIKLEKPQKKMTKVRKKDTKTKAVSTLILTLLRFSLKRTIKFYLFSFITLNTHKWHFTFQSFDFTILFNRPFLFVSCRQKYFFFLFLSELVFFWRSSVVLIKKTAFQYNFSSY